jgi:hypothetical protein
VATAVTYSTTGRKGDLRTVICEDVRRTVVLLPAGRLEVMTAKLLCGTASRCDFWAAELGLPDAHHVAIPASQIVAKREMAIGARVIRHK